MVDRRCRLGAPWEIEDMTIKDSEALRITAKRVCWCGNFVSLALIWWGIEFRNRFGRGMDD